MKYHVVLAGIVCLLTASLQLCVADEWPQWRGPQRDGVWRETGIIEEFDQPQLEIRWRAPIASGYSGPTVSGGRVFVSDRLVEPKQVERVHCFDAQTGSNLWTHSYQRNYVNVGYDAGPRASITIDGDRAYSLGAMGDLFCFDAGSGQVLWKKDCLREYNIEMPIWGIAASPLVEKDLLITQIGGEGACLFAFDKATGKEKWRALDDRASYSAPIIIQQAGRRVLVCWTGDNVVGLDPATGKPHWKYSFKPNKMVINISTPVLEGNRMFMTAFYDGSLMLKVHPDKLAVEKIWRRQGDDEKRTDALHSIIATPYFEGDYVYGVDSYGELRCLEAATGDRIWESQEATPKARWSNIHMVKNGDRMFMFNERGELIIARLSPKGYQEISRAKLIEPTLDQLRERRGGVAWAHPAYAYKHVFARNDKELVSASLAK
jgi:outer membrane protein assembly factor BamB